MAASASALSLFSSSPSLAISLPPAHKCTSPSPPLSLRPISCIASPPSPSTNSTPPETIRKLGPEPSLPRRLALPLLGLSLFVASSPARAVDIPLFGIRKRVEQAEKAVVEEVKELVKGSENLVKGKEKEVSAVAGAVSAFVPSPLEPGASVPPVFQAGAVAAAELVAVLVASSVVNGLVSES